MSAIRELFCRSILSTIAHNKFLSGIRHYYSAFNGKISDAEFTFLWYIQGCRIDVIHQSSWLLDILSRLLRRAFGYWAKVYRSYVVHAGSILWLPVSLLMITTSTSILQPFDGRSTAYQRSLRSQWRNPLAAVTLTYSFIQWLRWWGPEGLSPPSSDLSPLQ